MRVFGPVVFTLLLVTGIASAQPVPERHMALSENVDLPGGDLGPVFETDFESCRAICLGNSECQAFTFNNRSNACFPKREAVEALPFQGATSARIYDVPAKVLANVESRARDLAFLRDTDLSAASRFAERLPLRHVTGEWTVPALLNSAQDARNSGLPLVALRFTGAALAVTDAADQWVEYARLSLAVANINSGEARQFRERALSAAINGYLRSSADPVRASALIAIAAALDPLRRGRDMIPALRLANELAPRQETEQALADARAKYGFRVLEHRVDSASVTPRICVVFSEDLARTGIAYSDYVNSGQTGLAVTAEDRQLCVEGVTHGERYRIAFRQGLPAASGETLSATVPIDVYVRDRPTSVRFPGRGYVLPAGEVAALPVVTVNTDALDLILWQISDREILRLVQDGKLGRQLNDWEISDISDSQGVEIWRGTGEVAATLNQDVTTRLPFGEVLESLEPGLYLLRAALEDDVDENATASQWFLVSDLGVSSLRGTDGLHVMVRSLASTDGVAAAQVSLLSRANTVLGNAPTDADGIVVFPAGLLEGQSGAAPGMIQIRADNGDFAFLSLTEPAFDLSDRGVEGRAAAPPIDVFATTDRGAYRSGETARLTILARAPDVTAIGELPLTVILTRPDGVEYSRQVTTPFGAGGYAVDLPIGSTAPRGTWSYAIHTDPDALALERQSFLVEDFLPERVDLVLNLPDHPLDRANLPPLVAQADYLFGAPASDLPLTGQVAVTAQTTLPGFPGYQFGRHDESVPTRAQALPSVDTDRTGAALVPLTLPELPILNRPLSMNITLELREGNARPVERRLLRTILPETALIGIRPLFDGVAGEGSNAGFELLGLGPDLNAENMEVSWTLDRVETRYQWYQLYGRWNWEPTTRRTRVASGDAAMRDGRTLIEAPVNWGRYELVVERKDGPYIASSVRFYAGWYGGGDSSATPDVLTVSLDKESYSPGDIARARITPETPGTLVLSVLSDRVLSREFIPVDAGEQVFDVPVTQSWGAGAYITATLLTPPASAPGRNPTRALGLVYASVDPGKRRLGAVLDAPEITDAQEPFAVTLRVPEADGPVFATIAAVDVGILNVTGFDAPAPAEHYFGQRALGVGLRDLYGRLIDGTQGAMGVVRSGGDASAELRMQAPPPAEDLAVFWSGPLDVGPDGTATVIVEPDGFNGTYRVMAVVWSDSGVGQASKDVIARDPVVIRPTLPRFLAPGDTSELRLELSHAGGPAGPVKIAVSSTGPIEIGSGTLPNRVDLGAGEQATLVLPIRGLAPGDATVEVRLTTPEGRQIVKDLALGIRANDPEISLSARVRLEPGEVFTLDENIFAEFKPGTGRAVVSAGSLAVFDAPGLLTALERYPYGCTEQITSRALPLLAARPLAEAMGLTNGTELDKRLKDAIDRVLSRQSSNGSFGLWRVGSGDLWLDAYVTDFLSRARAAGVEVPELAFTLAVDNLRNRINYASDFDSGGQGIAYALYVLAREGAAAMGDLRYYADAKSGSFSTPLALAQLGAALSFYGDPTRADAMFRAAVANLPSAPEQEFWRSDYGTYRRDAAAVLTLAVEAGTEAVPRDRLIELATIRRDRLPSTQEAAWGILAAQAVFQDRSGALRINGAPSNRPIISVSEQDSFAEVTIEPAGDSAATLVMTRFGVPANAAPAAGNGYTLDRLYFTLDGAPVQLDQVVVGTRLVTVLKVTPLGLREGRLMVVDPLPAGFEIDNPSLLTSGDVSELDFLQLDVVPENQEFLSDRFRAAVDWRSNRAFQLAYVVRAVSPGDFAHPAALVEDMYRPHLRATTSTRRVEVTR